MHKKNIHSSQQIRTLRQASGISKSNFKCKYYLVPEVLEPISLPAQMRPTRKYNVQLLIKIK
uniref:Uncharacterized protein n=1 Tax=Rhizophora mucronata TaxID=61149 RepID=A0A2P2MTK5_RHIMU